MNCIFKKKCGMFSGTVKEQVMGKSPERSELFSWMKLIYRCCAVILYEQK